MKRHPSGKTTKWLIEHGPFTCPFCDSPDYVTENKSLPEDGGSTIVNFMDCSNCENEWTVLFTIKRFLD